MGAWPVWICFTGGLLPGGHRRWVLAVCHSGPERRAAAGGRTLMARGGTGVAGIGQLADGPGRRGRDDGSVEIRIVLDRAEPPAGRLRVVGVPGQDPWPRAGQEIGFSGWLGLLRALYEVTAESGEAAGPGP